MNVPLAAGVSVFLLSCPGAQICAALSNPSTTGQAAELAMTTDGGTSWTTRTVPVPSDASGEVAKLTCLDSKHCVLGLGDGAVLVTTDGGVTWAKATGAPLSGLGPMACASDGSCLAVVLGGTAADAPGTVTAFRSTDWGASWSAGTPTSLPQRGAIVHSSCSGAVQCMLVSVGGPATRPFEIITTDDAGESWQVSGPPAGWANMPTAVACATPTDCWIAMSTYDATNPHGAYSNPVIELTSDGGATWTASALPATTPPLADVNALSCPPSGDGCMGIGTGQDHFVLPSRPHGPLSPPLVISDLPR